MSAIGMAHVVPASVLPDLEVAASASAQAFYEALEKAQIATLMYSYSGWVLATLLPVLAGNYAMDLMASAERDRGMKLSAAAGTTVFVLTQAEKDLYADRLDPNLFSAIELRAAFEEFNAMEEPEAGEFMLDGIRFLRAGLLQLTGDRILLLMIG